jgi:hypothetical protein
MSGRAIAQLFLPSDAMAVIAVIAVLAVFATVEAMPTIAAQQQQSQPPIGI